MITDYLKYAVAHEIMNRLDEFLPASVSSSGSIPLEPVILNAGKSSNVMPADAELWYSFRTLLHRDEHNEMAERIIDEVKQTAMSMHAEIGAVPLHGAPLLVNSPDVYRRVKTILTGNGQTAVEIPPVFGGEDFAHYLNKVSGVMLWLGAFKQGSGRHHSPMFNPDEDVLWRGVHYWMLLAAY